MAAVHKAKAKLYSGIGAHYTARTNRAPARVCTHTNAGTKHVRTRRRRPMKHITARLRYADRPPCCALTTKLPIAQREVPRPSKVHSIVNRRSATRFSVVRWACCGSPGEVSAPSHAAELPSRY